MRRPTAIKLNADHPNRRPIPAPSTGYALTARPLCTAPHGWRIYLFFPVFAPDCVFAMHRLLGSSSQEQLAEAEQDQEPRGGHRRSDSAGSGELFDSPHSLFLRHRIDRAEDERSEEGGQDYGGAGTRQHDAAAADPMRQLARRRARERLEGVVDWCLHAVMLKWAVDACWHGPARIALMWALAAAAFMLLRFFVSPHALKHARPDEEWENGRGSGGEAGHGILRDLSSWSGPVSDGVFNSLVSANIARVLGHAIHVRWSWPFMRAHAAGLGVALVFVVACDMASAFSFRFIVVFVEMAVLVQAGNFSYIFA